MKRVLSVLLSVVLVFGCISCLTVINVSATSVVEDAISWAVAIANDNSHGYSWDGRWGPDYDCSSLVISAFRAAGCDTGSATYTGDMKSQFSAHGFQWIPWSQIGGVSNLERGDVLLDESSHTEIYLGNGQNVGAHRGYMSQWCSHSNSDGKYHRHGHYSLGEQRGDQDGGEISVAGYYNNSGGVSWDGVLRYAGGPTPCTCSEDYAGDYIVNTNSQPLTMRSGHGTGYGVVTSIPKGSQVYVSKSDGDWAHVEWNGYIGYCSMSYLKKLEDKSYRLHVWFSDTGMGDVPSEFYTGNRYYLCYELIDESTGRRVNETSNISYSATEKVYNSNGTIFEYTYDNSDNNWISFVCDNEDTYSGTVTISGDVGLSCSVSFTAWVSTAPQLKVWTWEGDDSNVVDDLSPGKTVGLSCLIRDKNTGKNLNDVTTFWNQGDGYTVTIEVYDSSGLLLKSQSFKNNDSVWMDFQPSSLGDYKMMFKVSGNLTGTVEETLTSVEKEHVYGIWQTAKNSTCTTSGVKERQCIFCGYKETQTIQATGHDYGSWITTELASCIEQGINTRTCNICNYIETQTLPTTGHTEVIDRAVSPTCTKTGLTEGKRCSVCNTVIIKQNTVDALGHSAEQEWTTIFESEGNVLQVKYCVICGDIVEVRNTEQENSVTSDIAEITESTAESIIATEPTITTESIETVVTEPDEIISTELTETIEPTESVVATTVNGSNDTELTTGNEDIYIDSTEPSVGGEDETVISTEPSTDATENPFESTDSTEPSVGGEEETVISTESSTDATKKPFESTDSTEPSTGDDMKPSEPAENKGVLGDVNSDGKVNIKDATQIQKATAKLLELTEAESLRADVTVDAKVNIKDATAIQKFVAKIETGFPIGESIA